VWGSGDAGSTFHDDQPAIKPLLQLVAENLNLAAHPFRPFQQPNPEAKREEVGYDQLVRTLSLEDKKRNEDQGDRTFTVWLAADVEGHLSKDDGRYYVVDLARLLPPDLPRACRGIALTGPARDDHLYRVFRPEFVASNPISLSSDAFSGAVACVCVLYVVCVCVVCVSVCAVRCVCWRFLKLLRRYGSFWVTIMTGLLVRKNIVTFFRRFASLRRCVYGIVLHHELCLVRDTKTKTHTRERLSSLRCMIPSQLIVSVLTGVDRMHQFYYVFGILGIVFIILIITCAVMLFFLALSLVAFRKSAFCSATSNCAMRTTTGNTACIHAR